MPAKTPDDPRAELSRLKAKMAAIDDRDIRAVLKARVEELEAQVAALPEEPTVDAGLPSEPPPPPSPEQAEEAERLVRHAMLEKRRGNAKAATELLQKAVEVAPGAPTVLEALGDDLAERSRAKEALELYARAMALDPKNVGLEKKHATLVYKVGAAGSIDDQLRANLSDSFLLTGGDGVANLATARALSFFVPGAGHLLLGRNAAGFALLGTYLLCLVWLFVQHQDVAALFRLILGGRGDLGLGIFPPLLIAIVTMFIAVGSLGGSRASVRKKHVERPTPPVNLPFE